jgi:hypothetical protein
MATTFKNKLAVGTTTDISGRDPGISVKSWFTVGCLFLGFMAYVIFNWVTSPYFGPTRLPAGIEVDTYYKVAIRTIEVVLPLAWIILIYTQIIKPVRRTGQPNTLGLVGIGFFFAIFWDPSMNFIQQGCVYNPYAFNLGFLSANIPGWMSPNANRLPEPLLAWSGGYPAILIGGCVFGLATMRWTKAKYPAIHNLTLAAAGIIGTMVYDVVIEILLIRGTGIYAYPGSIRSLSIWGGHWYQFPMYEAFLFGGWWGMCTVLLYFKDDKGLTWVERGVEKLDICKRSNFSKALVRAIAVIGFCQLVEVMIYVGPMSLATTNADPFPDDTPAWFTTGTGMCGPGTGLSCPRPDLPIMRRNDLDKFKDTPRYSHEQAQRRLASGRG